jgi:AraC-like DNA-binding protein
MLEPHIITGQNQPDLVRFTGSGATVNSNSAAHSSAQFIQIVRQHIRQQLPQQPSLATVAAAMHLSCRTLQRLLQQQHSRFRDLLADCRHQAALQHLADNQLSLQQIAFLLGFDEQSSFQKAFKCWQGCSPGAFRQHMQPTQYRPQLISASQAQLQVNYGIN